MDKFIGVWNYDFESIGFPLQFCGALLAIVFFIGLILLAVLVISEEFEPKELFVYSLPIPISLFLGTGSTGVIITEILVYVVIFVVYKLYRFVYIYDNLNSKDWESRSVNMDFQTFKNLYDLNPDRFEYTCGHWEYRIPFSKEDYEDPWFRLNYDKNTMYILIADHKEFAKYYKWNKQRLKQKAKDDAIKENAERHKNNVKSMQRILNQAQKDIDTLKKQADEEINMAADISKQVKERIELS